MPKAIVSPSKGLVQTAGSGFGVASAPTGFGLYSICREVDLEGYTPGGTTKEHVKSLFTLPANAMVTRCYHMLSEAVTGPNALSLQVAAISDAVDTANATDASGEKVLTAAVDHGTGGTPTLGDISGGVQASTNAFVNEIASATNILLRAGAGSNQTTAVATGKVVVYIEYIGSGPATLLDTL